MATQTTSTGQSVEQYIRDMLAQSQKAGSAAIEAGYPAESALTQAYYAGIPSLYMYGDPQQMQALERAGDLYGAYGAAGGYDKTAFGDIGALYQQAGAYTPTGYGDIEGAYRTGTQYGPMSLADLQARYAAAGQFDSTKFGDIGAAYRAAGEYSPSDYAAVQAGYAAERGYTPQEYQMADYTAKNIQERMSPYEELVASRQRARLKRGYDEARGEREAQAVRAGAFGGSGAAVQEEVARRNYLEQLADLDAQSLQSAFESGAGLYSKEISDRLAAQQAGEASRQFGKETGLRGLEGIMSAQQAAEMSRQFGQGAEMAGLAGQMGTREAEQRALEFSKQMQLNVLNGTMDAKQAEEASRQFAANLGLSGIAGSLAARQAGDASRQFANEAQFAGLAGLMTARQQDAAQTAAAKEAQFAGLAGQQEAARQQALMAEQRKNMQLANLAASQAGGQQQEERLLAQRQYPLGITTAQANVLAPLSGGVAPVPTSTQKTSTTQNILGGLSTAAGIVQGLGGVSGITEGIKSIGSLFAEGGLVSNDVKRYTQPGGVVDMYYDYYNR